MKEFKDMTNKQFTDYLTRYQRDKCGELGDLIREASGRIVMLDASNKKMREMLGVDKDE